MRPTLRVLSDDLIARIVDEALRVLAETGMEIRGAKMRQRLLGRILVAWAMLGTQLPDHHGRVQTHP